MVVVVVLLAVLVVLLLMEDHLVLVEMVDLAVLLVMAEMAEHLAQAEVVVDILTDKVKILTKQQAAVAAVALMLTYIILRALLFLVQQYHLL
jgi:hypothetical protein